MKTFDQKVNELFGGLVVRKDLVKLVKGNAIVPTYVLEYLLGQYCATADEESIRSGVETVKEVLRKHYVHRNEAGLIKSVIKEKGRHKVIDKISVALNDKGGFYEATFSNLGIKNVLVDSDTVKKHQKLLVSGIWCLADMKYEPSEDQKICPWVMDTLKPIQQSQFDFDGYVQVRKRLTTDEWIDLLIQSIGFNPEKFSKRNKLLQLVRLIPFCERNYNLIELGPKGTGKSHIYSEFSPHGILISGGEVSVPKLFVNNSSGKVGLVGYWDVVAFDEFAGKSKRVDKALVDIMKNYMANKSFSRGVETLGAEASMVFVGNTQETVEHMLKHDDLFCELPEKYHDSAFLDRLHFYIPGWEADIIRGELFSSGYGFVVDYLAEILRNLRNHDYSQNYRDHFTLSNTLSTRDRDGIHKTFSGLMKILYPDGEATAQQMQEVLKFAIEGRKRIKDQLFRIDKTYSSVKFEYSNTAGKIFQVKIAEEEAYSEHYYTRMKDGVPETIIPPYESSSDDPQDGPDEHHDDGQDQSIQEKPVIQAFGEYELLEQLSVNAGMAEVFKARKQGGNKIVFLKRVKESSFEKDNLNREMSIYNTLMRNENQYVLEILDVVRVDGYFAFVTEYIEGGDLNTYVEHKNYGKGISTNEAKKISINIAKALKEIHAQEIIHRDLKPANILQTDNFWKLTDFGISKNITRAVTQKTFQQSGTLGFTAPEQFEGVAAAPSADVYSFGKIMVFLLSGQTDPDVINYPKWKYLIESCLRKKPDERPVIDEVIKTLEEMAG